MQSKLFFVLSFFVVCSFLQNGIAQKSSILELVQQQMAALPEHTEFSIGIIENGEITKMGFRIENGGIIPVKNADAIFEIGSITKTFTASLIMQAVGKGVMSLDDPLQKYLPVQMAKDNYEGHFITLQHLLMHTSGLESIPASGNLPYLKAKIFSPKNPHQYFKAKHYYKYLKKFKLDYIPGKIWDYNNSAYGLLGQITADQNKTTWEKITQENLFDPLSMTDSYFTINKKNEVRFVQGISAKGKKAKAWEMDFINPAGVIKSTLNDMLKYAAAQLNPPTKELAFLQAAHDPMSYEIKMPEGKLWDGNSMGLGWWHNLEQEGKTFIWHGGASGGYTAFIGFSKEKNRAVVVLSNISSSHPDSRGENRIPKPMLLGQKLMRME
ncbi:MAG: serine hydrolase domain-containing protein [Saprospiraceae bacterium]